MILLDFSLLRLEFGDGGEDQLTLLFAKPRLGRGKKGTVNPLVRKTQTFGERKKEQLTLLFAKPRLLAREKRNS